MLNTWEFDPGCLFANREVHDIAVALGNALAALPPGDARRAPLLASLQARAEHPHALVREHVQWALKR